MADINILADFILSWEGGWSDHPDDKGGKTNMGVTLNTWKSAGYDKDLDGDIDANDLRMISKEDVINRIMKPMYWDRMHGDEIHYQCLANIIIDWAWMSGPANVTRRIQKELGLKVDGIFGPVTLEAINGQVPYRFFWRIYEMRSDHFYSICQNNASQVKFLKGWLRRLKGFHTDMLLLNNSKFIFFTWDGKRRTV